MSVAKTLLLFIVAAIAEIGGAWLIWQGTREHRGVAFIGAGVAALIAYGFVATSPDNDFGRSSPPTAGSSSPGRWPGVWRSTGSGPIVSTSPAPGSASSASA